MSSLIEAAVEFYVGIMSFFVPSPGTVALRGAPVYLHNTLSGEKELFTPQKETQVKMYNCGPTVYGPQHIGNLSMYVFVDILRRTLEYNEYKVKQVINFTDVGHLVSDEDKGEDKMTKGLKREKKALTLENMKKLGKRYAELFLEDVKVLNIETEGVTFPYASDYIPAQIAMVKTLEEKGYAYRGKHGVYYDTSRFMDYGKLGNINLEGLREGARVEKVSDKKNPTDFLLWKLDKKLGWDSPWGKGFPGWHIECSAMSHSILGDQIDIHTGGIEHIPVHHNNEIAQSEAALGKKPFSRFWLHRAHLQIEGAKIAKSSGKTIYVTDIIKKGFHPLAFRYLLLGSNYRSNSSFTWESLAAAQQAFLRLRRMVDTLPEGGTTPAGYRTAFHERINDDLDTPGALATLWEMIKDKSVSEADMRAGILEFDRVLGLGLSHPDDKAKELYEKEFGAEVSEIPKKIQKLLDEREGARKEKDWEKADTFRDRIEKAGFTIEDKETGPRVVRK